ncbi:MAG: OmpA family protein [Cyanobacteria bacterium]|nr:OmpA family protein [Cyanobacteriota bacterium]
MKSFAIAFAIALVAAQRQPVSFPQPAALPEVVGNTQDFPFLPPPPGARLTETVRVDGALELKSATADDEAVLAGTSYTRKIYARTSAISSQRFVASYRDALFAAGWKLIDVTKLDEQRMQPETVTVSAHYMSNGRNIYARVTMEPDGPYEINVADVGAEDWKGALARDCRVRIPSLHFDLDRPTLREYESEPTLEKLADLLKAKHAPAVEIQGHADNIGEAGVASRQTLSAGRAKIVASWLVAHGVPAAKVTSKGYGKTRPIADNDSDLGRAVNRRIEVACLKPKP